MKREEIIAKAREYIGTPWHHQGRLKGIGVDCIGLIVCVARELGLNVEDHAAYHRFPDGVTLKHEIARQLIEVSEPQMGDVLLLRVTRLPQHVALYTGSGILHAHAGNKRVIETNLSESWRRRIVSVYSFPGVE